MSQPIEIIIFCPACGLPHIDEGEWATKPHKTHQCQGVDCGHEWRPANVPTVGVHELSPINTVEQAKVTPRPLSTNQGGTMRRAPELHIGSMVDSLLITSVKPSLEGTNLPPYIDGTPAMIIVALCDDTLETKLYAQRIVDAWNKLR